MSKEFEFEGWGHVNTLAHDDTRWAYFSNHSREFLKLHKHRDPMHQRFRVELHDPDKPNLVERIKKRMRETIEKCGSDVLCIGCTAVSVELAEIEKLERGE